jgi:adenylate kinase
VTLSQSSGAQADERGPDPLRVPRVVMVGPPGSGKSSQARELSSRVGLRHLSSGDMLRDEVRRGTPIGLQADAFMRAGDLVPDCLVDLLYEQQLGSTASGFVLDGYPRTAAQARRLLEVLPDPDQQPNLLIQFVVPDDVVVERLCRRAQCVGCGEIFSVRETTVCPVCGGALRGRDDDRDDVVRARLGLYRDLLRPLLESLRDVAFRADIDADRPPEIVASDLLRLVAPRLVGPGPAPAMLASELRLP